MSAGATRGPYEDQVASRTRTPQGVLPQTVALANQAVAIAQVSGTAFSTLGHAHSGSIRATGTIRAGDLQNFVSSWALVCGSPAARFAWEHASLEHARLSLSVMVTSLKRGRR